LGVNAPVHFNDQVGSMAIKVHDKPGDDPLTPFVPPLFAARTVRDGRLRAGLLTPEVEATQLISAQSLPEHLFGGGHFACPTFFVGLRNSRARWSFSGLIF
jgi:hypothetical protein